MRRSRAAIGITSTALDDDDDYDDDDDDDDVVVHGDDADHDVDDDDGDDNDDEDGLPSNSQPPYSHQTSKSKVGKKCDKNCLKTPQKLTKRLILLIVTHFSCAKFSFSNFNQFNR